tara:strand:+ start:412 stop:639 length:228 start_codon:yes stop_codon:yes gene_type:complete
MESTTFTFKTTLERPNAAGAGYADEAIEVTVRRVPQHVGHRLDLTLIVHPGPALSQPELDILHLRARGHDFLLST